MIRLILILCGGLAPHINATNVVYHDDRTLTYDFEAKSWLCTKAEFGQYTDAGVAWQCAQNVNDVVFRNGFSSP
jgi:hypothetical protein